MLRKFIDIITSRAIVTLVVALGLSAVVWFLGPLFAFGDSRPLEPELNRFIAILVIVLWWGIYNQRYGLRHRRANERVVAALVDHGPAQVGIDDGAATEELGILASRLRDVNAWLKARFRGWFGKGYLYELPWYLMIGASGSGKTSVLAASGLRFSFTREVGEAGGRNNGATRYCDWWFAAQAAVIDTTGRYTTQVERKQTESGVWNGFLRLLKSHRARQAINGVIIVIGLDLVQKANDAERQAFGRTIRQRLQEMMATLALRFPVYVVFTKADLIAGFSEFFDTLSPAERELPWGFTFPLATGPSSEGGAPASSVLEGFGSEFDVLIQRLGDRMLERMHLDPSIQRRTQEFIFPAAMALMKAPIQDLLESIFGRSRFEQTALMRGVYFSSAVQDGVPSDQVTRAVAGAFGFETPPPARAVATETRGYFITGLLRDVVFAEANLAGIDATLERRRRLRYRLAVTGASALAAVLAVFWLMSYGDVRSLLGRERAALAQAAAQLKPLTVPPRSLTKVGDTDFAATRPVLDTLRGLPAGYANQGSWDSIAVHGGLYYDGALSNAGITLYDSALRAILLPRLIVRLEEQLRAGVQRADYLDNALSVYLMLGAKGPLERQLVLDWMGLDWLQTLPGSNNDQVRQALTSHLDALLNLPMGSIPLDEDLIRQSRNRLAAFPLPERGYAKLRQVPAVQALADWRLIDNAGPAASRVFTRPSGRSLADGVPGLFTYDGYWNTVKPAIVDVARQLARDGWVRGNPTDPLSVDSAERNLQGAIRDLYLDDYGRAWDSLLGDVVIVPFDGLSQAAEVLNSLGGPNSPLKLMLTSVAKQTALSPGPNPAKDVTAALGAATGATGAAGAPAAAAAAKANTAAQSALQLAKVVGVPLGSVPGPPAEQQINDRFAQIRKLVTADGNAPPPIDGILDSFNAFYQQLNRAASSPDPGNALLGSLASGANDRGAVLEAMRTMAGNLPAPVGPLVAQVARNGTNVTIGRVKQSMNASWTADVLPLCKAALDGRFPMLPSSPVDVTSADFAKLFAPGGQIDKYFNTNLKPFVDVSASPWKLLQQPGGTLTIQPSSLALFERAAKIRDAFFPTGAPPLKITFEVIPVQLDQRANTVTFEVDGQNLTYQHGPVIPVTMRWPNTDGTSYARVSFGPPMAGQSSSLSRMGPWSLLRLLNEGKLAPTNRPDRYLLTIDMGGRSAVFDFRTSSVANPFAFNLLEGFACPPAL